MPLWVIGPFVMDLRLAGDGLALRKCEVEELMMINKGCQSEILVASLSGRKPILPVLPRKTSDSFDFPDLTTPPVVMALVGERNG
jgi:hypothetical protein